MTGEEKAHFYRLINTGFALNESADRVFAELRNLRLLQASIFRQSIWQRILASGLVLVAGIPAIHDLLPDTKANSWWIYAAYALAGAYLVFSAVQFILSRDQGKIKVPLGIGELEDNPAFLRNQLSQYRTRWNLAEEIVSGNGPSVEELRERFKDSKEHWGDCMKVFPAKLDELVRQQKLTAEERNALLRWIPDKILNP